MRKDHLLKRFLYFSSLFLITWTLHCSPGIDTSTNYPVEYKLEIRETGAAILRKAFMEKESDIQIHAIGQIEKILPDDTIGSRHQRFIVRVSRNHTILIAHNIDVSPRIDDIEENTEIEFYGEYEWNPKGGVVHWTHKDPEGRHKHGYLHYNGRKYD
ncbi:MAG: DUF3465 domain-containing protein [Leptospiraceae bacterium]|nr:DUF3465 domain-containing protein [Leptospiraceae bacterium]